ncbi:NUDIX domain-containing protein [Ammoniphilus sp. CFH 90114]|uniref:NUDIX hydrolase n=1 Tax=Ammoniphilus sp. CFH 90114 TaxID=2493665 RepID=UPI00100F6B39|nr:NUDIX domain-containing protein [Ammoniphilus sp. CFH 90114]RXT05766.1 NUDIX domain-containing protein [Ammoniphilus sp. CFH 90114]
MEQEILDIYDEHLNHMGTAPREDVHKRGLWHSTFHCWVVLRVGGRLHILFQRRSENKEIYPNLLSVTAAGHLFAGENPRDGARELEEELGIKIRTEDLIPLGSMKEILHFGRFYDKAIYHIFLYESEVPIEQYQLQVEEVKAILQLELDQVIALFQGERRTVRAKGFGVDAQGNRTELMQVVSKQDFVPHETSYYLWVFEKIRFIFNY